MEKLINDFKISFTKGDTYALAVKFKNLTEDLRTAFFTVKENGDDEPLLQKSLGAGISKIDDRAYKEEKTYKLQIQAGDTANLEPRAQYLYDLQVSVGNVVKTVIAGVFVVNQSMSGTAHTTTSSLEVVVDDELQTELLTVPATQGIEYETDPVATAKIGDLKGLSTTAKETIVQAINEVKNGNLTTDEAVSKILNGTTKVPNATNADYATSATNATGATNDGDGNNISETYAKKSEVKHIYSHIVNVFFEIGISGLTTNANIIILNDSQTEFTEETLREFLSNFSMNVGYPVSGYRLGGDSGQAFPLLKAFVDKEGSWGNKNNLYFSYTDCEYGVDTFLSPTNKYIAHQWVSTREASTVKITDNVTKLI